ncbi:nitrate reductase [Candidatus Epulonipiscioides saccharophilum]|nr:nitrate reductase [Epulopiscium sp. SCG-B10WGA-EpuloB]
MKYIVIGASAAGINGIRRLRELDPKAEIILISKDEKIYSRCILHHYIAKQRDLDALSFVSKNFIEDNNITWIKGEAVTSLDTTTKEVKTSSNRVMKYDKLLLAAGGSVKLPPIPNLAEATNVLSLHNLQDADQINEAIKKAKNIIVLGAGLIGMDIVSGIIPNNKGRLRSKNITIVEMQPHLLSLQLDEKAAQTYQNIFTQLGINQFYNVKITDLVLNHKNKIKKIILSNGKELSCDLFLVASGIASNIEFLKDSGIKLDNFGVLIDKTGQTSDPHVYAAGDITGRNPIWPVAVKEGIIAASNMFGIYKEMDDFFISKSTMNFFNIPTMSLGTPNVNLDEYEVEIEDDGENYKKLVHKDGKIIGAILQGNLDYSGVLTQLIAHKIDLTKIPKPILKINYADFFHQNKNLEFVYLE